MAYRVEKEVEETTREQIEAKLASMGDYVRMSYLQRALNSGLDFETRKYVLLKLAKIYEERTMYLDSARSYKAAAEITTTYKSKIAAYQKALELYVKGGDYVEADRLLAQTLALGNTQEKFEIKHMYKNCLLTQANYFLAKDRRAQAKQLCEKLLTLPLEQHELQRTQANLLRLYEQLGNIQEYYALKKKIGQLLEGA